MPAARAAVGGAVLEQVIKTNCPKRLHDPPLHQVTLYVAVMWAFIFCIVPQDQPGTDGLHGTAAFVL